MKKILVGSRAFFEGIPGFTPHDTDYLLLSESRYYPYSKEKASYFLVIRKEKTEMLEWFRIHNRLSSFLFVPEVAKKLGITIEDLLPFREFFKGKYRYYQTICDAYQQNNALILTDEQREQAYRVYQEEYKKLKEL